MAQRRKTANKSGPQGAQAVVIFWLIFVIIIITVFIVNYDTILKNFNLFKARITSPQDGLLAENDIPEEVIIQEQPPVAVIEQRPAEQTTDSQPATQTQTQPQTRQQTPQSVSPTSPPSEVSSVQTRERAVYFTQIDRDGQILQSRVNRRIAVSETPMQDVLNAILAGPTSEELNRGILNLIPQNTRILSAVIRGNTAYISFSEDFMFNTFGVEGYVAQLRQIVWTVTEFPNVNDVQILIESRRLDYLGEGIWIGSPIGRQSF
ncbi:MAG: GerMN domain-containing protein [Treponema sp.]|nr:GerMN domain-containing protein [Treponema sp.]